VKKTKEQKEKEEVDELAALESGEIYRRPPTKAQKLEEEAATRQRREAWNPARQSGDEQRTRQRREQARIEEERTKATRKEIMPAQWLQITLHVQADRKLREFLRTREELLDTFADP
jgi:hypothetical protein